MVEWVLAVVFAGWFLLTITRHLLPQASFQRLDPFRLVPRWLFFAPTPTTVDFHVLARDRFASGTLSDWVGLTPPPGARWRRWRWFPPSRVVFGLQDACAELADPPVWIGRARRFDPRDPHRTILHWVLQAPAAPEVVTRQYVVTVTHSDGDPTDEPEVVFLSAHHPLGA